MEPFPDILWIEEIKKEDIPSVGGKGASLGEMFSIGLPVPRAFTVTAQAFRRFLVLTGIEEALFKKMEDLDVENAGDLEQASREAKEIVLGAKIPADMRSSIRDAYHQMGKNVIVAVRSSATAEDLPDASFAGQQDTYLNIKGDRDLLDAVQKCWASLYGGRAIYYRAKQG
ncbi:MAG: phosphoenolpyruvate synthase, partial [Methanomicrobiales archaeon]|nr:phosphoenolpyruvate synthase [Methanomicrobiales archaeon]